MACVLSNSNFVFIGCGSKLFFIRQKSDPPGRVTILDSFAEAKPVVNEDGSEHTPGSNGEPAVPTEEGSVDPSNDGNEGDPECQEKADKNLATSSVQVLCCDQQLDASQSGGGGPQAVALCNNRKQLCLYKPSSKVVAQDCPPATTEEGEWHMVWHCTLEKQATAVKFIPNKPDHLLVSSRFGFVTEHRLGEAGNGKVLLGHMSLVLDLCILRSPMRVITCDRDEKIRVSCYPNAYNIDKYLLKHTDYVRSMALISRQTSETTFLASVSADGLLIIWNLASGEAMATFSLPKEENVGEELWVPKKVAYAPQTSSVVISFERNPILLVVKLDIVLDQLAPGPQTAQINPDAQQLRIECGGSRIWDFTVAPLCSTKSSTTASNGEDRIIIVTDAGAREVRIPASLANDNIVDDNENLLGLLSCVNAEEFDFKTELANAVDDLPLSRKAKGHRNMEQYFEKKREKLERGGREMKKRKIENCQGDATVVA